MAEFEGYLTDAREQFDALEQKLTHDLDHDLDYAASDIRDVIAVEIVKRYYYQRGAIIEQLKNDDDLRKAIELLTDADAYQAILSPVVEEQLTPSE